MTPKKYVKLKEQAESGQQTIQDGKKMKILWVVFIVSTPWLGVLHPFFATMKFLFPLFCIGVWTLLSILKVEREADDDIANCVFEGIQFEKQHRLPSGHFSNFLDSFSLKGFAFIRASPPMMLVFFLVPKFLRSFSESQPLLRWSIWAATISGFHILFLGVMVFVSKPYTNLLKKLSS